jgi:hypothetical protein
VFTYSIKFLIKPIMEDLNSFYSIYFQLILSKNKHIRRFACESFAYIMHKISHNNVIPTITDIILRPLLSPHEYIEVSDDMKKVDLQDAPQNFENHCITLLTKMSFVRPSGYDEPIQYYLTKRISEDILLAISDLFAESFKGV